MISRYYGDTFGWHIDCRVEKQDNTKIQSQKRNPMETATKLIAGIAAMVTPDSQLVREWTGLIGCTE
jgi:hypothetical protein